MGKPSATNNVSILYNVMVTMWFTKEKEIGYFCSDFVVFNISKPIIKR